MPGTMSIGGLASGIKTDDVITKIMEISRRPQVKLQADKTAAQARLTAWMDLNAQLIGFKSKADAIASPYTFRSTSVSSSDTSVLTAAGGAEAVPGVYDVKITSRAQASQVVSSSATAYDSVNAVVGSGIVTISLGNAENTDHDSSFAVTIDSNNNTLVGLRDAINRAEEGVSASIMNVGTTQSPSYKLLLTSSQTGADFSIKGIASTLDGSNAPTFNTAIPVLAGADAVLEIGSGVGKVTINKSTNTISDVIPGVTISVLTADLDKTISLQVTRDSAPARSGIEGLVQSYNDFVTKLREYSSFDSTTYDTGVLFGDYQLQAVQQEIESVLGTSVSGVSSQFSALSTVGITLGSDGKLAIDSAKLSTALANNPTDVLKLFSYNLASDSASVSLVSQNTNMSASTTAGWQLNVSQIATRSQLTAGAALNGTLGANETLHINGTAVSLGAGWTLTQAISEINRNSDTTNVTAFESIVGGNHFLNLRSVVYGSGREISVFSSLSNAGADTSGIGNLLATASTPIGENGLGTGQTGLDIVATLQDGATLVSCTGLGQTLTVDSSSTSSAKGMVLQTSFESAPSGAITLKFTKGIGATMQGLMTKMTGYDGTLTTVQDSVNSQIESLTDEIASMETRLLAQQDALYTKFNAMEVQMSRLQSQGNYLTSAFAAMNSSK